MRQIGYAPSGLTLSKRIRACIPVIIVLAAFAGFTVLVNGNKPFRVVSYANANNPKAQERWPEVWIYTGLSRIRSAGFEIPWYQAGNQVDGWAKPLPSGASDAIRRDLEPLPWKR